MAASDHPILFFDGVCNLCNGAVQWFLKNDRSGELRFASLQSELAQELLPPAGIDPRVLNSLVFYHKGRVLQKSDGALAAYRQAGGMWGKLAGAAGLVPRFIRDGVYGAIARNRYRWFGKRNECMLPRPEWKARFVG